MWKGNIHGFMEVSIITAPKTSNHKLVQIFAVAGEIVTYMYIFFFHIPDAFHVVMSAKKINIFWGGKSVQIKYCNQSLFLHNPTIKSSLSLSQGFPPAYSGPADLSSSVFKEVWSRDLQQKPFVRTQSTDGFIKNYRIQMLFRCSVYFILRWWQWLFFFSLK